MPKQRSRPSVSVTLGDLLADEAEPAHDLAGRQSRWLLKLLADGPRPVPEIKRLAQDRGWEWAPIKRLRRALPIVPECFRGPDGSPSWI
jgi:hypothetical protein